MARLAPLGDDIDMARVPRHAEVRQPVGDNVTLPIVGLVPGTGRMDGLTVALVCRLPNGQTVNVSAGLTRRMRHELDGSHVGAMVEVAANGTTDAGTLRAPRSVRFRFYLPRHWSVTPQPDAPLPSIESLRSAIRACCSSRWHVYDTSLVLPAV